ncbi:MAG: hypothetical protein DIU78_004245 [Pseudomonadota bacterium]
MLRSGLVAAALAACALFGCRSEEKRALEIEADRLGKAIDALRAAPNEAKGPLLRALQAIPCSSEPACELKAVCTIAYAHHVSALEASARAADLLKRPGDDTKATLDAAGELARAEADLASARELTERCAAAQGELRRSARNPD